jgi:hypothetical protein
VSKPRAKIYAVKPVIRMLKKYASKTLKMEFISYFLVKIRTMAKPGMKKQRAIAMPSLVIPIMPISFQSTNT